MQIGPSAPTPQAYLEFCGRQPRDCQISREVVLSQSGTAAPGRESFQTSPAAIARSSSPTPGVADWANWASLVKTVNVQGAPAGEAMLSPVSYRPEAAGSAAIQTPAIPAAAGLGATLVMSSSTWSTVNRVNNKVNRSIIRRTDVDNFGVEDRWNTPLEDGTKFGDCEDYALEKRRALIAEGFPPSALSLAIVTTAWNATHAVLLVASDKGEYVLDNLSPWVVPWNEAPYIFRKRQVAGDTLGWARVVTQAPAGARPLLIARAD